MVTSYADDRAHVAVSYRDDATMLHMGFLESFKISCAIRKFCLRACPHRHGPETQKCQPCCVAESLHLAYRRRSRAHR